MKLIHLTDTHFVPCGKTLYGGNPRATLERAIADINLHHADADLVVITGDLTHWGEPEAFHSLAETLSELSPPSRLLLGNHDDREIFGQFFPGQPRDEDGFVQSVMRTALGRLVFLDTNLEGTHAGWFCEARRAWLNNVLADAATAGEPVYLFMHHPPFPIGLEPLDNISLQEPELFRAVVEPHANNIRQLFLGHIHRPLAGSWLGIPVFSLRAMNHQCWLDFNSRREIPGSFEPPAYAVVLMDPDKVIIHTHDFMDPSDKFSLEDSPVDDWAKLHPHP